VPGVLPDRHVENVPPQPFPEPAMRIRLILLGSLLTIAGLLGWKVYGDRRTPIDPRDLEALAEIESRLASIATRLEPPRPGEWLDRHKESGQTFREYLEARPVRRSPQLNTIYICLVGDFTPSQRRVLDLTLEYMRIYFNVPVKMLNTVDVDKLPASARREHPTWGDRQVLTSHILYDVLKPNRSDDALAYLAFTANDLWPGEGWNFVFGQASLSERVGVWSMYRNGDPAPNDAAFRLCLRRTIGTAAHETGHILTMQHCIAYECNMNGSNHQAESDRKPLYPCPVCLRKLCWNLQVEPTRHLTRLAEFCEKHELKADARWYRQAAELLKVKD
jgi:archaemetzincin